MKRVLLTGATGFLGRPTETALTELGFEVHRIVRNPGSGGAPGVVEHVGDLLDPARTTAIVNEVRASHLLHLAWAQAAGGSIYAAPQNYDWLVASLGLARAFAGAGGRRLVLCGTSAEYDWRHGYCTENLTPCEPESVYGATKHALHTLIASFAKSHGLSHAWPRPFFTYGPGEERQRFAASIIVSLLRGQAAPCSHGKQLRDYLYVKDLARALAKLVESEVEGPVNVSSGEALTLRQLGESIGGLLGRAELIQFGALPARANDHPLVVGNNTRLIREVGWQPETTLQTGLELTIEWWRQALEHSK